MRLAIIQNCKAKKAFLIKILHLTEMNLDNITLVTGQDLLELI